MGTCIGTEIFRNAATRWRQALTFPPNYFPIIKSVTLHIYYFSSLLNLLLQGHFVISLKTKTAGLRLFDLKPRPSLLPDRLEISRGGWGGGSRRGRVLGVRARQKGEGPAKRESKIVTFSPSASAGSSPFCLALTLIDPKLFPTVFYLDTTFRDHRPNGGGAVPS